MVTMLQSATWIRYNPSMAILHVRGIPEALYKRAQRIAVRRGKSLSQLVIESLGRLDEEEAARRRHVKLMNEIRQNMETRQRDWAGRLPSAVSTIHEIREEREQSILGTRT